MFVCCLNYFDFNITGYNNDVIGNSIEIYVLLYVIKTVEGISDVF